MRPLARNPYEPKISDEVQVRLDEWLETEHPNARVLMTKLAKSDDEKSQLQAIVYFIPKSSKAKASVALRKAALERLAELEETVDVDQLAEAFGIPKFDDWYDDDSSWEAVHSYIGDPAEDASEDEREEHERRFEEARDSIVNEQFATWYDALMNTVERAYHDTWLELVPLPGDDRDRRPFRYRVQPSTDAPVGSPGWLLGWRKAATRLAETISGHGGVELSGPEDFVYTTSSKDDRDAVLQHLSSIPLWYRVYEGTTAQNVFYRALR